MNIQLIQSGDGSHTLFVPELNETYHSHHGALQESLYVFIEKGLKAFPFAGTTLKVFEVGFGTGLNALLTYIYAEEQKLAVDYYTLEPYPLPQEIVHQLNYLERLNRKDLERDFYRMHEGDSTSVSFGNYFRFNRYKHTLETFDEDVRADVVYFDAFAPNKQPGVWSLLNFIKLKNILRDNGILVSYCASGQFKRNLKEAGFEVETLPGPPGKKEMTRGVVKSQA